MDYQELEAFKKLPPMDREIKMVQDLDDVKVMMQQLISSKACPFSSCGMCDRIEAVEHDVGDLKKKNEERKETKRTWVDYLVNGVIALGAAFAGVLIGRGG